MKTKAVRENYQTAGQPFAHGNMPGDHEDDRATADVVAPRGEDARPMRRKFHPMWIIIPLAVAVVLFAVLWGGAYLVAT